MTATRTEVQYAAAAARCRAVFLAKAKDYGASWTVLRPTSATDQLYIKARRIRSLEETGENRVGDSIESEFLGIYNYCIIALILCNASQRSAFEAQNYQPELETLLKLYDQQAAAAQETMQRKNHDYGEAWRDMRIPSFTDMLLVRLMRIKQIEDNGGNTRVSEGVEANYIDMMNYAIFALIKIEEARA